MKTQLSFLPSLLILLASVFFLCTTACISKYYDNTSFPEVTTAEISDITSMSAAGGGNVISEGSSPVTERGLCYGEYPNPTILNNEVTSGGSGAGAFSSNLRSLKPNTIYYVRAYASNEVGTAYGNEVFFATKIADLNNGDLEIFVRQGNAAGPYIGGAVVEIFLSELDRDNGNVFRSDATPTENVTEAGAEFLKLPVQKYFIRAAYANAQGLWSGDDEFFVIKDTKVIVHVVCEQ